MGLFNFARPNASGTDTSVIQLALNEEIVTVPAEQAKGKTISELFTLFASQLGDTSRINRYVAAGRIVDATATPEPGTIYRGAVGSESKGRC